MVKVNYKLIRLNTDITIGILHNIENLSDDAIHWDELFAPKSVCVLVASRTVCVCVYV